MTRHHRIALPERATALCALLLALSTAGCATGGKVVTGIAAVPQAQPLAQRTAEVGAPLAAGDAAMEAAALLTAADEASSRAERAPLLARLDELGVHLADGATDDDPLEGWRQADKGPDDPPSPARALGPAYRTARVAPGQRMVIEQIFLAGQHARIAAQTSDGGQVALAINNPRREPVCTRQLAPAASCNWMPIYTERFAIHLHNRGRQPVNVYLVIR
jgi:hypothetical protein